MKSPDNQHDDLQQLVRSIEQAGLRDPLALILDALRPIDVISSQFAQFARPFLHGHSWRRYADALAEERAWHELRRLLDS
jgi:hypothetical protein